LKVVVLGFALYLLMSHDAPGFHPSEVISFNGSSTLGWVGIAGSRYWYLRGTNPVAVLSTAIGAGLYFLLPEAVLRCLVTPILTGLVFVVITRLLVPRFEWARVAAEPISVPARAAAAEEAGAAVRP
jgi:hypothetical protein